MTDALLSAARPALAAAALLALAALVGVGWLPARCRSGRSAEDFLVGLSAGISLLGVSGWLAGTWLGTWAIPLAWAGLALPLLRGWRRAARGGAALVRRAWMLGRRHPVPAIMLMTAGLALTPQLLGPLADSDGLRYHVALPKLWLLQGAVSTYPYDITGFYPQTAEVLYLAGQWLAGGETAKFLHAGAFLASLAAMGLALHRDRRTRRAALVGPLLFAATPVALLPAAAGFIDHVALLHLAAATLLVARRGRPEAVGACLGGALATKWTALPAIAGVALVAALARVRGGRPTRALALVAAATVAVASPFLVRAALATGDPIFPIGHVMAGKAIPGATEGAVEYHTRFKAEQRGLLGISWDAAVSGGPPDEAVGWHHLIGLAALLVPVWVPAARPLWGVALPFVAVGLIASPPTRLLLPMLWALAALEAVALSRLRRLGTAIAVVAALPGALAAVRVAWGSDDLNRYLRGAIPREVYLERSVPGFAAARAVAALPAGGAVMALDFPAPYYLDRPWIAEGLVTEPPLRHWLAAGWDADRIDAELRRLDVRAIVVTPGWGGGTAGALMPLARAPGEARQVLALRSRLRHFGTFDGVDVFVTAPAPTPQGARGE
ncbi:MAG: hypothetical protein ACOY3Y_04255 [Acidobacteriota bacterium]